MELITTIIAGVISSIGVIAAHFIAHDAYTKAPQYARHLIERAVRRLPEDHRARYLEEWLSDLDERLGVFSKFQHAVECWLCVRKVADICSAISGPITLRFKNPSGVSPTAMCVDVSTGLFLLVVMQAVKQHVDLTPDRLEAAFHAIGRKFGEVDVDAVEHFHRRLGAQISAVALQDSADKGFSIEITGPVPQSEVETLWAEMGFDHLSVG